MAAIMVISDRLKLSGEPACTAQIVTDDETGETRALTSCEETITDRGNFEDTVEAASLHVDMCDK